MSRITQLILGIIALAVITPLTIALYYGTLRGYTTEDSLFSGFLGWATDTQWAAGYKEEDFSKITLGMTRQEVQSLLGRPIWEPNDRYWGYTKSASGNHYHQRGVVFSSLGVVTNIVKGFYFD